ncbi:23S rRNA pseudouridylate synthase B [Chromobacterium sphagni]|uniref:Pseudouridine synthase n=1 Tax=Chromobacterium sphagni TaxID=1903179 RepID=A0A1S1X1H1_9NEIS|nr:pseudouridine synthase [Chromobacterium sphagni]OHX13240.1 23S rRNA pseudouridylate synthase B [Chromobacterium sphagni]OHX16951.1 23S rRNA pseudouridylate synthase B [Chromobacterium sphagni]
MSTKGQRTHARQPAARAKGGETAQPRQNAGRSQAQGQQRQGKPGAGSQPRFPQQAGSGQQQNRRNGPPRQQRDANGNPVVPSQNGVPLFKLSRREQEQQALAAARTKPVYTRDSNGDVNGNVAFDHERRFGNKNAATPVDGNAPKARGPRPEGEGRGRPQPVQKAKKLRLRSPSQDIKSKSQKLKEVRVDLNEIEPIRLQKALSSSGVGSRREMEEWIEAGLVTVNGKKASLGDKVGPHDRVMVKGDAIKLKWPDRLPRVIMYHKEEGEIVTRDDPEGRVTVFDRLPQAKSSRWVAIGRLDVNTSGLLLITTSGELANRMMHPSFEVEREYSVRVMGELTPEISKEMVKGVELEDGPARFDRIFQTGGQEESANQWYNVVIKEGRNREVRRMFEHFGLTVSRLMRVRFGNIGLPPRLKRGQFYELNPAEVAAVMKWSNLTVTGGKKAPTQRKASARKPRTPRPE